MNYQKDKISYFLYARKSSESEDRQVQSIDDQIDRLKKTANQYGITIKEILTESKSAKQPGTRPVFNKMLERIEAGEAGGILCWQLNRLSRNPVDSGRVGWLLQQGIIQCIQTNEKRYLPEDNVLLFSVESGMANQFIIELRKNSQRGMEGKADRGWLPSRAPLGYLNDKINHEIIPDPERFALVRRMWDMMLTGNYTPPQIADIANTQWGFLTPTTKKSTDNKLVISAMYKMFNNLFYTGSFQWSGKEYKGNHKPMITYEEYDRVQVILGRHGKPRAKEHAFAFTGMIKCSVCGGMYSATEKQKFVKSTGKLTTYTYYHCSKRKKGVSCDAKRLTLEELEGQITQLLERYTIREEFKNWALDILKRRHDVEVTEREKIYEQQHRALEGYQKQLDSLLQMRIRELIGDSEYLRQRDMLQAEIARLQQQTQQTEARAEKWVDLTERTFNFACYARREFVNGDLAKKKEIFAALGENFFIKDQKVFITPNDWLVPLEKASVNVAADFQRLEPTESIVNTKGSDRFDHFLLSLGAVVQEVRTIFEQKNDATIYIPVLGKRF